MEIDTVARIGSAGDVSNSLSQRNQSDVPGRGGGGRGEGERGCGREGWGGGDIEKTCINIHSNYVNRFTI